MFAGHAFTQSQRESTRLSKVCPPDQSWQNLSLPVSFGTAPIPIQPHGAQQNLLVPIETKQIPYTATETNETKCDQTEPFRPQVDTIEFIKQNRSSENKQDFQMKPLRPFKSSE